jgi:hypothetical protein
MIDNNLLPENIAKNKINNSNRYINNDNGDNSQEINSKNPRINSIKSFQNGYFNLNVSLMNVCI